MSIHSIARGLRLAFRIAISYFVLSSFAQADYLDISPAAQVAYYSYASQNYHSIPGAKYLGVHPQGNDWRYVPWETLYATLPGNETFPASMKGLKAMIAAGSNNYGVNYQTIHTDPLTACINYVH